MKYRLRRMDGEVSDKTIPDTWTRVAKAIATAEPEESRGHWEGRFREAHGPAAFLLSCYNAGIRNPWAG